MILDSLLLNQSQFAHWSLYLVLPCLEPIRAQDLIVPRKHSLQEEIVDRRKRGKVLCGIEKP